MRNSLYADMAELADALDSGSNGREAVQVQVLLSAPYLKSHERWIFPVSCDFYMFLSANYNSIIVKITLKMQHSD